MTFDSDELAMIRSCCRDDAAFEQLCTFLATRQAIAAPDPIDPPKPAVLEPHNHHRMFAEGPVVAFRWLDAPNWPVEFVSANVAQFGYHPADFATGKILYGDLIHPDDRERVAAEVDLSIAAGKPAIEQSYRITRADGEIRWVYDLCGIVRDQAGKITCYEGYVMDITDRKLSEQALRESEERFAAAFWCSPTALTLSTLDPIETAKVVDVNDSFVRVTGYSREEAVGRTVRDLNIWVNEADRAKMLQTLHQTGSVINLEMQFRRRSGEVGTALMSAEVIHLKGQSCLLTVTIDITSWKQAQEALQQSEQRNRAFLNAIPDLMFRIARDGTYLDCKADRVEDFAFLPEEMMGKKIQQILPPDLAQQRMHYVEKALQTGKTQIFEYQFSHHGELRDYEARLVVSGTDEVTAIMRDITDRKRSEAQLRANTERDRLLGQIALRIRRSLNLDQILTTTVEEVRQFLGVDRVFIGRIDPDWQGKILVESVDPEWGSILTWITNDLHLSEIRSLFAQGHVQAIEDTTQVDVSPLMAEYYARCQIRASLGVPIRQDEQFFAVLVAQQCSAPRPWNPFEIELMVQLATQVAIAIQQAELYEQVETLNTTLKQQVEERTAEVIQKMQEVEQLSQVKDEFLHTVSHDLRTPVTGLSLVLKNLVAKAGDPIPMSRSIVERMVQSCDRQIALINSLLDAHSIEIKGISLDCEAVDLANLVATILADLDALLVENSAKLQNQILAELPPVCADPTQLRRVFENLMTNALKHNPPGLHITLNATREAGMIRCTVSDNGVGMSTVECETLFERYARSSRARRSAGIGLGLYVSRQIITAHGGIIGATSAPGEGATFWFTLPVFKIET